MREKNKETNGIDHPFAPSYSGNSTRKILCIGASNTFGHDPRSYLGSRYPAQVRWTDQLNGWDSINCGVNGMTVPNSEKDCAVFIKVIQNETPDLVAVMLGTNDLLEGKTAAQISNLMEDFIHSLSETGRPILLIAPPPLQSGEWVQSETLITESRELAERYREIAYKQECLFANAGEWDIEMAFDGVHFSPAGHAVFAKRLENCIRKTYTA